MKILSIPALACAMTLGFGLASAQTITPSRVGPVSQYGQLMTGKNSAGEGRIYGSCQGVKDGAEVQVRGMSLYWSLLEQATEYWSKEAIVSMVRDMNIQIVRAAMATGTEDWSGPYKGYQVDGANQKKLVQTVVEAAIDQDIYVIIDWHSHNATEQVSAAQGFFSEMSQQYGAYDNVIFELFNEPTDIAWSNIKNYANQVIPKIRANSDNLILVGTRAWDQHPEEVIGQEVTDSGNNTAYTLHYYAMSHCVSGTYDWGGGCEGSNGEKAIKAGLSIFISEWGTGTADGGGTPGQSKNDEWQAFASKYKLSWANWSASHISEGTAAFSGGSNKNSLQYTASGNMVKGYLATNPTTYTKCADGGSQTGNQQTGDNSQTGNNNQQQTGDNNNQWNQGNNQWNQGDQQAIVSFDAPSFNVSFSGKTLNIAGATAQVEIFTLKGDKLMSIDNVTGSLSMAAFPAGKYMVRVKAGSTTKMQAINIK